MQSIYTFNDSAGSGRVWSFPNREVAETCTRAIKANVSRIDLSILVDSEESFLAARKEMLRISGLRKLSNEEKIALGFVPSAGT